MDEMGDIHCVVSPISVPVKRQLLPVHIKKNAFLVHVATEMPVAMDEQGVLEFVKPLFQMQALGSRNNVMIAFSSDRLVTADALLVWQLFGGIALPVIGTVEATLKVIEQMMSVPMNAFDAEKRGLQFVTGLPMTELAIADDWSLEQSLVYALVNGNLPHSQAKEVFNLSQLDREVLLRDILEKDDEQE